MIEIDAWVVEGLLDLGKTVNERVSEYNVTPRLSPSKRYPINNGELCSSYYSPISLFPVNSSTTNSPTIISSDKNNVTTPTNSINTLESRCPPKIGRKKKRVRNYSVVEQNKDCDVYVKRSRMKKHTLENLITQDNMFMIKT